MALFIVPSDVPKLYRHLAEFLVNQRHIGESGRTHRDLSVILLLLGTVEISVKFAVTELFGVVLKTKLFHHLIQRDRVEALHDLQALADRGVHRLLFQPLKEVALNTAHVDFLEYVCLVFPICIAHCDSP